MDAYALIFCGLAFLLAAGVTYLLTPTVIRWSWALKIVALPGPRKIHKDPVPSWGGVAVLTGFLSSVLGALLLQPNALTSLFPILLGLGAITAVGTLDDAKGLRPGVKLIGQVVSALIPVLLGVRITFFQHPFAEGYLSLSQLQSLTLSVLWIVSLTNALNLIDGLDGLACGVSLLAAVTLAFFSLAQGLDHLALAVALAGLAGACAGFLPFNFHPAKVFLGDTGAMGLGYLFATLSIAGTVKRVAVLSLLGVTVLVLAYPIADTLFAILRRWTEGRSLFSPDRGHLHHRLIDSGWDQSSAVLFLYLLTLTFCLLAFLLGQVRR